MIRQSYATAKEIYGSFGVDTDEVLKKMDELRISIHCWQTDDVGGFETPDATLSGGGILSTGNYPGKAMNIEQVRADLEKVFSLLPGKQRLNLHAIYGDFGGERIDRDQIELKHFQSWIDWCKKLGIGMDFNATCFSHPRAADGFTLSSKNEENRKFWVEHVRRCRAISAEIGKQLGTPCVHNTWIPDGSKDTPIDRNGHRVLLKKSLDEAMAVDYPRSQMKDAVESKVFGIGAEAMTVGTHDFYLGYAISKNKLICLDNGHFHPTEQVGDKISSCLLFLDEVLLHVTRPIRWDSDHVVILNDDLQLIAHEIVRNNFQSCEHRARRIDQPDRCLCRRNTRNPKSLPDCPARTHQTPAGAGRKRSELRTACLPRRAENNAHRCRLGLLPDAVGRSRRTRLCPGDQEI